jgi:hypothetical protein
MTEFCLFRRGVVAAHTARVQGARRSGYHRIVLGLPRVPLTDCDRLRGWPATDVLPGRGADI